MNRYPNNRRGKPDTRKRGREKLHRGADALVSVLLIVLCFAALFYVLQHPELPMGLKQKSYVYIERIQDFTAGRNLSPEGLLQPIFGRNMLTILLDMLVAVYLVLLLPLMTLMLYPFLFCAPSVARITPYALPMFVIIGQLCHLYTLWKQKEGGEEAW